MAIDAQAKIDLLEATYDKLAAEHAASRSMAGRSIMYAKLQEVRAEIEWWERRRDRATRAATSFTAGRPTR